MRRLALFFFLFAATVFAGEDPSIGVVTIPAGAGSGSVTVKPSVKVSFQTVPAAVVKYRFMTAAESTAGSPVPTDGGGMTDGGVWGPTVDFTLEPLPYKTQAKSNQTKLWFYTADGGAGLATRIEVHEVSP